MKKQEKNIYANTDVTTKIRSQQKDMHGERKIAIGIKILFSSTYQSILARTAGNQTPSS